MVTNELSDLIGEVGLGNRQAFRQLYNKTSPKLFGVCLRILSERRDAEDALQEVYLKVWHNAQKFTASGYSPITWLAAIARNHSIDRIRARKPQSMNIQDIVEPADDAPGPELILVAASDKSRIDRCLDQLKSERADAVRDAYIEGYSYQELAEHYKLPINTLRTWLRRSLISLRECLQR